MADTVAVRYAIVALTLALAACAPLPADGVASVASVGQPQLATAIPSQTATPDIGPQLTQAAVSQQRTVDAARALAGQATISAEWTAISVKATVGATHLEETEVAATAQAISATQTQGPLDVAATATVAMQQQINATATAIAGNADSETVRADAVEWSKRTNATWSLTQIGIAILILIAGVCVVYYVWRGSENKAEGIAAVTRANAYAITLKAETEAELMRERDKLSARLRARIQEVGDLASERATAKAVPPSATTIVQEPTGEGPEPGTYNATTELVLRTLSRAASIAALGWDDPVIPPQGLAWGGNGTRQKVVDLLNERGLVRTERGQGTNKGTRVQEYGTIRGLYDAIADGHVVIYDPTAPLEVTAEA